MAAVTRPALWAAGVVLLGAAAGFASYRVWLRSQAPGTQLIAADVGPAPAASGIDTEESSPAVARLPVPELVPPITLPDPSGRPRSLQEFLGHPLIINFWATWCAPCRREIPLLQQLQRTRHDQQLAIVGVAVDFKQAVDEYIKRTPLNYPTLIGEDQGLLAAQKFGMESVLPFSVFSDADGRIVAVKVGELHREEADLILDAMQGVAASRETLPAARSRIAARLRELAISRAQTSE
jgi:thiol-disulfide isomerase/thioredoxin